MTDRRRTPGKSRLAVPAPTSPTGRTPIRVADELDPVDLHERDDHYYEQKTIKKNSIAEIVGTVVQTALGG